MTRNTLSKEDAAVIVRGLLHSDLRAVKLSDKARDELRAALEKILEVVK
jgi:hypothetical protein